MAPRRRLTAWLLALLLAATACVAVEVPGDAEDVDVEVEEVPEPDAELQPDALPEEAGTSDEPTVEAPQAGQDLEVPLEVVEGPGGSILAFVPVLIDGEGPYGFALDTGASTSVIDRSVADELGLEPVGEAQGVTGVTGATETILVQLDQWQSGEVDLGARPVLVLDLGAGDQGPGLEGLLGSDVLSQFGAITVDYDEGVLRLRPRSE